MSVNKAILIGRLGKDPEVRRINEGTTVCNFPLATREVYKTKEGDYNELTEWHNIVMWRGIAERAEKILKKGMNVYIEGKIKTRSWEKDGVKRYITEIVVENFQLVERRNNNNDNSVDSDKDEADAIDETEISQNFEDDLPF
ncbi:MAG: single-stranded DNA-binding protein [Chitinophagales bacterium]|nr:single-stranded DNA-binding protein [Chitinophagales bacterium]